MADRPAICIVDDEPVALTAMLDALARRFGGDTRVISHLPAHTALDAIGKMKNEGEEVALVIADQRMPEMTGGDFSRTGAIHCAVGEACTVQSIWATARSQPRSCRLVRSASSIITCTAVGACRGPSLSAHRRIPRPNGRAFAPAGMRVIHIVGEQQAPRSNGIRELLNA